ncbi:Aspartate--ammonia ligase [Bacteroidales bacterium Barb6]|nr:Aspartate--ammonia ligase [Bacteroidales bacterium Barb6]OAV66463.1 Aspartate--ammonia ligase [Bacteroidales bacterium Barb6XT]
MPLIIPKNYVQRLMPEITEQAIWLLKNDFQEKLSKELKLRRVTAPLFVLSGTGINDDLNGVERPVRFPVACIGDRPAEVVHSLAKWKRTKLGAYSIPAGYGLFTDMNAIRSDEDLDNIHSLYVDQWDWEKTIRKEDRNLDYLKKIVRQLYAILKDTEQTVYERYPHITPSLPQDITFFHSEELLRMYPTLPPREREAKVTEKFGAVFVIGIGGILSNSEKHDGRAPDYDDWSSSNAEGFKGLNGDIILWNDVLGIPFELSSMGIRVNKEALTRQLDICGCPQRKELAFHKALLNDELPLSIGGGIGQSRLCMYFLKKAHIGEVQASVWPEDQIEQCRKNNIYLL